jgi:hypothetical protein
VSFRSSEGRARALLRGGAAVAIALLLALGGASTIDDAVVGRVERDVRAPSAAGDQVALVYFDDATLLAWPEPAWTWARHAAVLRPVLAGGARAVVVSDYGPGGGPLDALPADLAAALDAGRLFLPPGRVPAPPHLERSPTGGVRLAAPTPMQPTPAERLLQALGRPRRGPLELTFLANPPAVPAHRVASGEITAAMFKDRVVLLGTKAGRLAVGLPTPIGSQSAAELELHAVATALGAPPRHVVGWLGRAGAAVLGGLLLWGVARWRPRWAAPLTLALIAAIVGGGLAAAAWTRWYLPPTVPLLGVGMALALGADRRARELDVQVARLAAWADRAVGSAHALDDAPWQGFVAASRTLVEAHSAVVAELPAGAWHLQPRASDGVAEADIVEPRRDVRREPFRDATARQRASWATRPMFAPTLGVRTLVVPLVGMNQVLGMWFINFPVDVTVAPQTLQRIDALARQFAAALAARRAATPPEARGAETSRDADLARALRHGEALAAERDALLAVDAASGVGELVASTWGQVERVNDAMAALLGSAGLDGVRAGDGRRLAPLLATLTGTEPSSIDAMLRDLLDRPGTVRLAARLEPMLGPAQIYDLALTVRALDALGGRRILLTAVRRADAPLAPAPWIWQAPASADQRVPVDLAALLGRLLAEQQRRSGARPLEVELPAACEVAVAEAPVRDALTILLGELQHGAARGAPAGVRLVDGPDEVGVELRDPDLVLTEVDVRAIRAADLSATGVPMAILPLVHASQLVRDARGELTVRSDLQSGTTIRVVVRRSSAP